MLVLIGAGPPGLKRTGGHREATNRADEARKCRAYAPLAMLELRRDVAGEIAGLSKARQGALLTRIDAALRVVRERMPFVSQRFGEHLEARVEKAKSEVHGWMQSVIQRAGLASLRAPDAPAAPIQIDNESSEDRS